MPAAQGTDAAPSEGCQSLNLIGSSYCNLFVRAQKLFRVQKQPVIDAWQRLYTIRVFRTMGIVQCVHWRRRFPIIRTELWIYLTSRCPISIQWKRNEIAQLTIHGVPYTTITR
jgi:hypothetical protein